MRRLKSSEKQGGERFVCLEGLTMDTPEGNSRRLRSGPRRGSGPRGTAGGTRATVLGSLTIPGRPEQVATARAFVARTLSSHQVGADHDAATLLTSEFVTNAGPVEADLRARRPAARRAGR